MFTNLSAVQINRLAKRLSNAPLGRSASVAAAAERFGRLLAAKIGAERVPKAIRAILTAPGFETAEGRLVAEIDACETEITASAAPEPAVEPKSIVQSEPTAVASAPRRRRDAELEAKARQGELPSPPDFSAPTHARFRAKQAALVELAGKANATGLRAVAINPVSSSPKGTVQFSGVHTGARCQGILLLQRCLYLEISPANTALP